jgi:hypothetical protein
LSSTLNQPDPMLKLRGEESEMFIFMHKIS